MKYLLYLSLLFFVMGCNNPKTISLSEKEEYLILGDSITNYTQMVLLSNVSQQIQKNGTVQAVAFCNEKAMILTDSLSNKYRHPIKRLTDKSRNIENQLQEEMDLEAWEILKNTTNNKHLILQENNVVYYYKAIPLAMPTCLQCHGNPQTDILPETLKLIKKKYPQDKATNYKIGDFRGMWKVQLN